MVDATAMSTPITRSELREEIERLETRFDQLEIRFDQKLELLEQKLEQKLEKKFDQKLAPMATKADLEIWGGALHMAMKTNFESLGGVLFERLQTELARHVKAVQESLPIQISAIDDKYADLPARVNHLEFAVFAPKAR
jgi:chaperonin cofactor prefoldin